MVTFAAHKPRKRAGQVLHAVGFSYKEAGIIAGVMVWSHPAGCVSHGGRRHTALAKRFDTADLWQTVLLAGRVYAQL
jgi:LDH2 family malate/lactate/ureidoglycolate dehydrogenase